MNELSDDERNLDQPPGAGSSGDLTGLHILLVEDSPDIGDLVKTFLELEGTIVAGPATTAEEARKLMAERRPHVALVDFHLRDGNAYGLIARLRELGVPVIMISGSIEFPVPISLEGGDYAGKTIQRSAASRVPALAGGEDNSLSQDYHAFGCPLRQVTLDPEPFAQNRRSASAHYAPFGTIMGMSCIAANRAAARTVRSPTLVRIRPNSR
jgi:CheY-like chemotaxis protein